MLGLNVDSLSIVTSLKTERYDIDYNGGLLSLDKNTYNNIVDYEVELEETSLERAQANLKELCEKVNIEYKINHLSKQARAMNSK